MKYAFSLIIFLFKEQNHNNKELDIQKEVMEISHSTITQAGLIPCIGIIYPSFIKSASTFLSCISLSIRTWKRIKPISCLWPMIKTREGSSSSKKKYREKYRASSGKLSHSLMTLKR